MTLTHLATRHPRWLDAGIRLDRVPPAAWLAAQALTLWPTWRWMAARLADGSDDPLGLLALAALAAFAWQQRRELRAAPRLGLLACAGALTLAASLLRAGLLGLPALPPLAAGLLAVLALAAGLLAFLPRRQAAAPVLGLAVLALPLLSSLQFYAGYPLRVLTAEAGRWLLAPFFDVAREGSSLWIDGQLVIVDAPCSGVQMVWLGYFTACAVALFLMRCTDRRFLARLPAVSALVLAGNVLRNAVLVGLEGAGRPLAPWAHEALGLAVLAAVCGGIAWAMLRPAGAAAAPRANPGDRHALA
ncbi:exosortase Q [Xenophilus azovorans]|uniref:exosortase Q n=1 Tax=Xenophilus azovorans TaxID=151755 RepID=UPI00068F0872|nr:exosortase Q [Xenophilus azovorans]